MRLLTSNGGQSASFSCGHEQCDAQVEATANYCHQCGWEVAPPCPICQERRFILDPNTSAWCPKPICRQVTPYCKRCHRCLEPGTDLCPICNQPPVSLLPQHVGRIPGKSGQDWGWKPVSTGRQTQKSTMRERFAKPLEEVQTVFAAHGRLYVWEVVHDGTAVMHEVERADSDKKWKLPNDFRAAIHVPIQERCAILGRFAIFSLPDRFAALDLVTGAVDGEMPCGKPFAQIAWLDHWVGWVRDESRENDWRMQLWIARQPSAPVWKPKAMLLFEAEERSEIAPWGAMLLQRRRVYWATRYGAVCSLDLREQSEASQPTELVAPRPKCRCVWFCGEENGVMVIREEGDRAYALRLSSGGPEVELYGLRGPLSAAYVVGNRLIAVGQAVIMYDTTTWQETKRVACPPGIG